LPYDITIKKRAQRVLDQLDKENHDAAKIISNRIVALGEDPYTPRPGMDIALIKDSNPRKHRLRIGAQTRIEFTISYSTHIVNIEEIIITKRRNTDYKIGK
jgi:mRNA-degrading endonuclease RelE of RelBE toxin-antitoxin system